MLEVHAILQRQRCNENITKKTGTLSDAYFENCQQVKQRKTLRLCSRICRTAFFIQSTFIADSNTVPVESSHMRSRFRYRPAMVKFPIAGDVKMITYILETSLQMTLSKLFYGEGNIAARCAAMNHQQLNLTWEIAFF